MQKRGSLLLSIGAGVLLGAFASGCARHAAVTPPGKTTTETAQRLADSEAIFRDIMSKPDKAIPRNLLNSAWCVAIVPGLKKGAFVVGAQYGRGFLTCRQRDGTGWTAPGGVRIEGGSFGLQIGGSETDVVLLVMNKDAQTRLLTGPFTLGADASAAAGPVGRTTTAQTGGAWLTAQILSWSRARGVFAGISLTGSSLRSDDDANRQLYGKPLGNRDIIEGQLPVPASAKPLVAMLTQYSPRRT